MWKQAQTELILKRRRGGRVDVFYGSGRYRGMRWHTFTGDDTPDGDSATVKAEAALRRAGAYQINSSLWRVGAEL